jgi:HPt (histidine-containing phosphotransfer) domain-containing protein
LFGWRRHHRSSTSALSKLLNATLSIGTLFCLSLSSLPLHAQAPANSEYRSKANFLCKFPIFVEWPAGALPPDHKPFRICVLGDFPFGTSLAELSGGTTVHGGRVEIQWIHREQESRTCQVLFVSRSEQKRHSQVLEAVRGRTVLTVGETPEFFEAGGIVNFAMQEGTLQFDVNLAEANRVHLKISSRLLTLARRVVNATEAAKNVLAKMPAHQKEQTVNEKTSSNLDFNYGELLARVDNDRELLYELLRIFKEEFPRHLQALREAVGSGDGKLVAAAAHTLKGMLLNLAAAPAAAAVARLEQAGRNGEKSGFQDALAAFERDASSLLPQLDACMAEVH